MLVMGVNEFCPFMSKRISIMEFLSQQGKTQNMSLKECCMCNKPVVDTKKDKRQKNFVCSPECKSAYRQVVGRRVWTQIWAERKALSSLKSGEKQPTLFCND